MQSCAVERAAGYLRVVGNLINEVFCEVARIGVQDPHPVQPFKFTQLMHKLCQTIAISPVLSILVCVLCYEVELLDPRVNQILGLI